MPSAARVASNRLLREWCAPLTGRVLSVGSGDDRDGEGRAYRAYFGRAASYTTSDEGTVGLACDRVLDVRAMPEIADAAYDAIFCSGLLEHVDDLGAALAELWRVLAPGGLLLLGVPFRQAIHRAPQDFWRFTEHGIRRLLAAYEIQAVVPIDAGGTPNFPATYWVKARKPHLVSPELPPPAEETRSIADADVPLPSVAATPAAADHAPADPLTVVCWKWAPPKGYPVTYTAEMVNILSRMVAAHYPRPHRFVCVTDDGLGLDPAITVIPLWTTFADVPSPHGSRFPSCYRRLRLFDPEIRTLLGPRFVSLDLDCVITGDLRPLWDRPEDFVVWRDTHAHARYNGSMLLMTAGARPQVWQTFDPATSPAETLAAGDCNGSDQGWFSYVLGPSEATWTERDGLYSFKNQLRSDALPTDARVVFFHGAIKPWSPKAVKLLWVRRHYLAFTSGALGVTLPASRRTSRRPAPRPPAPPPQGPTIG